MNTTSRSPFREVPRSVEPVLTAARRIYPQHSLFVTVEPDEDGPAWEFHPVRRYLILRTEEPEQAREGIACSLLARNHCLGRHMVTAIPGHLRVLCTQLCVVLGCDSSVPGNLDRTR